MTQGLGLQGTSERVGELQFVQRKSGLPSALMQVNQSVKNACCLSICRPQPSQGPVRASPKKWLAVWQRLGHGC